MAASSALSAQAGTGLPACLPAGTVARVRGHSVRCLPDGRIRPLQVGDQIQPGDLILAAQNAVVEMVGRAVPVAAAASAVPVEASTDTLQPALDRIIAELSEASGVTEPDDAAEVNSLWPGLRVDRVIEVVAPPEPAFELLGRAASLPVTPAPAELTQIERQILQHSQSETAIRVPAASANSLVFAEALGNPDRHLGSSSALPQTESLHPSHELSMVGQFSRPSSGAGAAAFIAQDEVPGRYGLFSVDRDGAWTYSLDHASVPVQSLRQGDSVRDQFTVSSADGSTREVIVTVHGRADSLPVCSYGDAVAAPPAAVPAAPDHVHEVSGAAGVFAWHLAEADAHHAAVEAALIEMVTGGSGAGLDLHDLLPGAALGRSDSPGGAERDHWWQDRGERTEVRNHGSEAACHPDRIVSDAGHTSLLAQLAHPDRLPQDHGGG